MIQAVGAISQYSDPEYLRILRELMALGITPSGNKDTDKMKLEKIRTELVQKIQTKPEEEQKHALQVQPLEAVKDTQQARLEEEKLGAMQISELNKLYFGLL